MKTFNETAAMQWLTPEERSHYYSFAGDEVGSLVDTLTDRIASVEAVNNEKIADLEKTALGLIQQAQSYRGTIRRLELENAGLRDALERIKGK